MTPRPPRTNGSILLLPYARQSKGEAAQNSVGGQHERNRARADREGWPWPRRVYTDIDRSGGDASGREAWNALLEAARDAKAKGLTPIILADHRDRVSRGDALDTAVLIRDLAKSGARICYSDGGEEKADSQVDSILLVANGIGPVQELERCEARIRKSLRERVQDGYIAASPRYGFTCEEDPSTRRVLRDGRVRVKKWLRVDPAQAAVVVRVWREFGDGAGYAKIARGLTADGIQAPGGGVWKTQIVYNMVHASVYVGRFVYGKTKWKREGDSRKKAALVVPPLTVKVPRIVDEEIEARVAARLAVTKGPGGRAPVKHALIGILKCSTCGAAMCSSGSGGRVRRYTCLGRKQGGPAACTSSGGFTAPLIEGAILDYVREQILPLAREAVREAVHEARAEAVRAPRADVAKLKAELADLRKQKGRLVKALAMTDDDADVAHEIKQVAERISAAERGVAVAEAPQDDLALRRLEEGALRRFDELAQLLVEGGRPARDALRSLTGPMTIGRDAAGDVLVQGAVTTGAFSLTDPTAAVKENARASIPIRLVIPQAA